MFVSFNSHNIAENENEDDDSEEDEEEEKKDGNDDDEEEEEEAEDKPKTENNGMWIVRLVWLVIIVDFADDNEAEAAIPSAGTSNETSEIDITQPSTSKGEYASAGGDEKSEEDEDTISNFEISWDLLTSAEKVFARNLHSKENRLHLAEALQKRAEISIEWENNDEAIQLLNECIDHRKSALPADHRLIAEAYHYLGVAYSFKFDYENSNLCFESAIDIIQLRLDNLVKMNTAHMDEFEKTSHEKEIEQLRSLIPDLRGKMDDLKEQMQSQYKTLQTLEKECEEEETKKLQMNKSKPVNNISHLIKRKVSAKVGVHFHNQWIFFLSLTFFYFCSLARRERSWKWRYCEESLRGWECFVIERRRIID